MYVLAECIFYGDCVWFVVDRNKFETREGVRLNMILLCNTDVTKAMFIHWITRMYDVMKRLVSSGQLHWDMYYLIKGDVLDLNIIYCMKICFENSISLQLWRSFRDGRDCEISLDQSDRRIFQTADWARK